MKTVGLIAKVVMFAVILVGVVLALSMGLNNEIHPEATNPAASADGSWTGYIITSTIITLGLGILGMVVDFFVGIIINPASAVKTLASVVGAVILVAVLYNLADSTPLNLPGYEGTDNQSPWLEIADTGIFLFYISAGAAVLSIIYSEVRQMLK